MKFWDSSALVPLVVEEKTSRRLLAMYRTDSAIVAWWGSEVECASALARLEREHALGIEEVTACLARLDRLRRAWIEVEPSSSLRETARRLLRAHDLRAADALQIAAATEVAEGRPSTLELVTLDERLGAAASKEGFVVVGADRAQGK